MQALEEKLAQPKPLLSSQSNLEEVKGIGPKKAQELKEIGITNVGEFITSSPETIAKKMESSDKTVERLQSRAQFAMVPGLNDVGIQLLEEAEIKDRKSLGEQDPIDLSKKLGAIFKTNVDQGKLAENDKPTIEQIESWVKYARS